jgi:hypothetical protein
MYLGKKRVGVAENPRSGVEARGSSVKKGFLWKRTLFFGTQVLPLLNFLTVVSKHGWFPNKSVLKQPQISR